MSQSSFKMLCAIDFSDSSERALMQAAPLAQKLGAALHLVHVCPIQVSALPDALLTPALEKEDLERSQALLADIRGRLPLSDVQLQVRVGDPLLGLLDAIEDLQPDLVVVGSHGRGAMMRALLGSVSERLCRKSPVPVLVVPAPHGHREARDEGHRIAEGAPSPRGEG